MGIVGHGAEMIAAARQYGKRSFCDVVSTIAERRFG